jgi:citrate synthase
MLDQAVKKLLEPASRLGLEGALHRIRDRELVDIPHLFSSPSPRFPRGDHFSLDVTVGRAIIFGKRKSFRIAKKWVDMRIGKQDNAFTAIATSDATSVTVRGHDLCDELIGKINFTDYFWLLVLGEKPNEAQRDMMDACLVAIAEHGLVPSVQAARMTLAAGPDAWQGAMSAGLLGMGSVVAGSSESAGRYLAEVIAKAEADGTDIETAAIASLKEHKALRRKVAGLGHPQHSGGDPRADRLLAIADDLGISGKYIETLRILGQHAPGIIGRPLPINVSGAIPACILDAGWPLEAIKAVPLLARAAGLSAHLYEESLRSIGFIMSHKADEAIAYDGKASSKPSHAAE